MRWALKRQFLYALVVLLILAVVGAASWFAFFYRAPGCFDNQQNGDETGVDCGGSCTRICEAPHVSALWARSVEVAPGVYHAVALVQNPESGAGTASLPYHFSIYDASNILIAERYGTMYLTPGEITPLFEADITTGSRIPAHTFVAFGNAVWQKMSRAVPPIAVVSHALDSDTLRLTAHLQNTTALSVPPSLATALLYDADGNLVTASQTLVDTLPPRGEKDVVFTWQEPFAKPVVRVDIVARLK